MSTLIKRLEFSKDVKDIARNVILTKQFYKGSLRYLVTHPDFKLGSMHIMGVITRSRIRDRSSGWTWIREWGKIKSKIYYKSMKDALRGLIQSYEDGN